MYESIDRRLNEGWLEVIHLETDDFPEPVLFIYKLLFLLGGFVDSPATPQVIATTGRGSLSLRPRNALSEEYAVRTESGILAI